MKKIDLTLFSADNVWPLAVTANGEHVRLKRDRYSSYSGVIESDADEMTVRVYTYLEIKNRLWVLISLLYYFIGLFGLFDRIPNRKCRCLSYEVRVRPGENSALKLRVAPFSPEAPQPVTAETDAPFTVEENRFFVDTGALKRLKIMRAVKIMLTLALIGIAAAVIINMIIN